MEKNMDKTPFLNHESTIPLYVQLYDYFKKEIEEARLPVNTKLPSIRQLALHLKVSRTTVENAYQQLVAEGYVESKPKSGIRVLEMETSFYSTRFEKEKMERITPIENKSFIDFQYGDIDVDHFPMRDWRRCIANAVDYTNSGFFTYGDKQGHIGLREEIAKYLLNARGVECDTEDIVLCAGTQSSIFLLCQLLELFNHNVAMEEPGYDGVRTIFEKQKIRVVPISIEGDGISMNDVEKSEAKALYLTPSHQFPLGMILSITKRMKLLQWADKENSYLIEDDYDSEFRYQGQPIPSLKSLDHQDRVIYLGTFSKAFLPATRVSYIVLPKALVQKYKEEFSFLNQSVSPIIQEALYQFMKNGLFERHIRRMRKTYQLKHNKLIGSLYNLLGQDIKVIGQKAGLHLMIEINGQCAEDLIFKAEQAGVKVYPTKAFWMNKQKCKGNMILLGYGGLSEAEIEEGIEKLKLAWFG
jgi:GntR family transcriptional regulator / MocR family aminotransferase